MIKKALTSQAIEKLVKSALPEAEMKPATIPDVVALPAFAEKMQALEVLCGCPYSEIDHNVQDALVLRRLGQMINTMMLNPLWKEAINQAGLTAAPKDYEQWQQLPLADKTTQRELFMGNRPGLVVPLSYGRFEIVASGGTSSGPVESVYSIRELHDTYKIAGDFMGKYMLPTYLTGDAPKWMITTLADYQMWSSGTMVGGVLQNIPDTNYIGAGPMSKEVYQYMMSYEGPKAIMGISASIACLTDLGEGMDQASRDSFRVAMFGSGLVPTRKQAELKEMYPNLVILSYFAATQAETIGLQLSPDSYLASVPGLHLIEIVDEEGRWVKEGEEGDLVITRLHAHEAPLIRFKLGDRMIRRANIDLPGLKTQQFEFSGRSGDIIHLNDTQYVASQAYESLCSELKKANVFDLDKLAHDIQFVNHRKDKKLCLIATVDDVEGMTARLDSVLGEDGLSPLFIDALIHSLSLFNKGEANPAYLKNTGYFFSIKLIDRQSEELHRTTVGKVPVIRDVF
jgi:phenylacetate-CoA ligase